MKILSLRTTFFLCLFLVAKGFASTRVETFLLHPNKVFVETGTLYGEGIQRALLAGFQEMHSIELSPKYYSLAKESFQADPKVHIYFGDSSTLLFDVIKEIDQPITFWLDAHYSGWDTASGRKLSPILEELEQIGRHPIKTHTILIDDVRLFGTYHFDYTTLDEILKKLYEINPHYTISYENGFVEEDILVAQVKESS